jgi:hypothetical protein
MTPTKTSTSRERTAAGIGAHRGDIGELEQILADLAEIEPLVRRSADLIPDTVPPSPSSSIACSMRVAGLEAATRSA